MPPAGPSRAGARCPRRWMAAARWAGHRGKDWIISATICAWTNGARQGHRGGRGAAIARRRERPLPLCPRRRTGPLSAPRSAGAALAADRAAGSRPACWPKRASPSGERATRSPASAAAACACACTSDSGIWPPALELLYDTRRGDFYVFDPMISLCATCACPPRRRPYANRVRTRSWRGGRAHRPAAPRLGTRVAYQHDALPRSRRRPNRWSWPSAHTSPPGTPAPGPGRAHAGRDPLYRPTANIGRISAWAC